MTSGGGGGGGRSFASTYSHGQPVQSFMEQAPSAGMMGTESWRTTVTPIANPPQHSQLHLKSLYIRSACADPEGGQGVGIPPPLKSQNIGFLSNTGPDPLKITKLPTVFIVRPSSARQRNAI